ncbi:hypothetical protein CWE12_08600 [Aliidiomarina sedimenti]|uniref:Nucleotidyl transferase domain-containing protein n=1 Tax=Aliidiomarina sedimenti TaxID=1933879 RepID=A0ABY0BZB3_9GAMM|nr:sugar phosphate nucleotidyltransferase [Aliidiomarina sedimenti]RUO30010.1 hypothetical protein CWE12_08600 [Aliidiomarina sedimenti]
MLIVGILSAGLGTRLNPYTLSKPKPLVSLPTGSCILSENIKFFCGGFRDPLIKVISGYKSELFSSNEEVIKNENVQLILNPFFKVAGPLGSIWSLLTNIDLSKSSELLICNGDTILFESIREYVKTEVESTKSKFGYYLFVSESCDEDDDGMRVALVDGERILAVSKDLDDSITNAYSTGVLLIKGNAQIREFYGKFKGLLEGNPRAISDWNWHSLINVLISDGILIGGKTVPDGSWLEIDSPNEYINLYNKMKDDKKDR